MATTALKSWNAIRGRHESLKKDARFQPDKLTALCERLDDLGVQLDKQKQEQIKAREVTDDAGYAFEAGAKKIADKLDTMERTVKEMEDTQIADIEADDAVKDVSKWAASYVKLARELAEVAHAVAKASEEQAAIAKKSAEQFKTRREAVDAVTKKVKDEGSKRQDQIGQQLDAFRKIAAGMKDNDLARDIAALNGEIAQLYSFQ